MKIKTPRNKKYLDYIRSQTCCMCGDSPSQAAHVRIGGGGGMGLKPSDYYAVPLCWVCHAKQHAMGERSFWGDRNPDYLMSVYMLGYLFDLKAAKEQIADMIELERIGVTATRRAHIP